MSLDNPNGIESSVSKNSKQRRSFLIKTSAVTVVASLPLRSSWAAGGASGCSSVSGNLSGNVSQNCTTTNAMQGKSPSVWSSDLDNDKKNKRWRNIFGTSRPPFDTSSGGSTKVKEILGNPSHIDAILLAAFFNAEAGLYGTLTVGNEDYVRGLYDQINNGVTESEMIAAIQSTYNTQ
jgi:hypothetical protein